MIAILAMTASLSAAGAEETAKVFPASGLRALEIRTAGGDVSVQAGDASEVKVSVVNPDAEHCEITMEQDGSTLRLKAKDKSTSWFRRSGCDAGFAVEAPKSLSLEASAGSGAMKVAGLEGTLTLNAGSGSIELSGGAGDLRAKVGSGTMKGNSRSKRVDIKCGSGAVALEGLQGSAEVRSGSGSVDLKWSLSPEDGEVDVKTGSGDVSLVFPDRTKLQTEIRTGSGRFRNEIGDTASAKFRISVKAGSGDVTIGKRAKGSKG
ncbi:MAG: DUF4097 family beta strand repeat protein [Elusimicrobia bacterium]|nr:DUF4097 family beta strand repeat protein [Elusimicrobiota bacterium]